MNYYGNDMEYMDIPQLKKLPQFAGMSENDLCNYVVKVQRVEREQWEAAEKARLDEQRKKDLDYIEQREKGNSYPNLPTDSVQISFGWEIPPSLVDDRAFLSEGFSQGLRKTVRLGIGERKIYIH
jgi:hypothetical protein